jgi:uncharacterized protein (TIRG00374 family)
MKKAVIFIIKAAISLGLMVLLLRGIDMAQLQRELTALPLPVLGLGAVMLMGQSLSSGLRWHLMLNLSGLQHLNRFWCIRTCLMGSFFNQCLPSSIGGDAMRVLAARQQGLAWKDATATVLAERASGLFCFILLAVIGGGVASLLYPEFAVSRMIWAGCVVLLLGVMAAIGAAFAVRAGLCPRFLKKFFAIGFVEATTVMICKIYSQIGVIGFLTALGLVNSALNVAVIALFANAMGQELPWILLVMPVSLGILATIIPLSLAGWGLRESTMIGLLGLYQVPSETALILSVAFGLAVMLAALPGAIAWLWPAPKMVTP